MPLSPIHQRKLNHWSCPPELYDEMRGVYAGDKVALQQIGKLRGEQNVPKETPNTAFLYCPHCGEFCGYFDRKPMWGPWCCLRCDCLFFWVLNRCMRIEWPGRLSVA